MKDQIRSTTAYIKAKKVAVHQDTVSVFSEEGQRYDFSVPEGIGDGLKLPPAGASFRGASVAMSSAGTMLYGFKPLRGSHPVKFVGFAKGRDEKDPKPKTDPGGERTRRTDGQKYFAKAKMVCTLLLKITAGEWKDVIVPWQRDYNFERGTDGTTIISGTKAKVKQTHEWLNLCGFDSANEDIPYSDNLLPYLEPLLCEANHPFMVIIEDGWITEADELPAGYGGDVSDEDDEDEWPARRSKSSRDEAPF